MKILYLGNKNIVEEILKEVAQQYGCGFIKRNNIDIKDIYEVVFIDYEIVQELDDKDIDSNKVVVVANSHDELDEDIRYEVLKTPFLPHDAYIAIESRCPKESKEEEDIDILKTDILDPVEIDIVKSFLEDVESDTIDSDDMGELSEIDEYEEERGASMTLTPDELISLIERLKPKKVRKLLKGSKIEITITFPKDI